MKEATLKEQLFILLITLCTCLLASVSEGFLLDSDEGNNKSLDVINGDMSDKPVGSGLTCWTCPNKTDNDQCNDWAPDVQCPMNHTVCMTKHRVYIHSGESAGVEKLCTRHTLCTWDIVGCYETAHPNIMECISCCNYDYCNEPVPFNHTNAIQLSESLITSGAKSHSHCCNILLLTVITTILYITTPSHSVTEFTTGNIILLLSSVLYLAIFTLQNIVNMSTVFLFIRDKLKYCIVNNNWHSLLLIRDTVDVKTKPELYSGIKYR